MYEPAEDTFALLDALEQDIVSLKRCRPNIVLEIGSGSGCVSTFLAGAMADQRAGESSSEADKQVRARCSMACTDASANVCTRLILSRRCQCLTCSLPLHRYQCTCHQLHTADRQGKWRGRPSARCGLYAAAATAASARQTRRLAFQSPLRADVCRGREAGPDSQ